MLIRSEYSDAVHEEPICKGGCGGFAATPNRLCPEPHGVETPQQVMERICRALGHVHGQTMCLRCKATLQ